MSSEPLTRSEVFGQLRRELYGEEQPTHSNTHTFIILGASVSTMSQLLTTWLEKNSFLFFFGERLSDGLAVSHRSAESEVKRFPPYLLTVVCLCLQWTTNDLKLHAQHSWHSWFLYLTEGRCTVISVLKPGNEHVPCNVLPLLFSLLSIETSVSFHFFVWPCWLPAQHELQNLVYMLLVFSLVFCQSGWSI